MVLARPIPLLALAFAASTGVSATSAAAATCEVHIWAADTGRPTSPDPATLSPLDRSRLGSILDAGQRLYEIEPSQVRTEFSLPDDAPVTIHHERSLSRAEGEKATSPLEAGGSACVIDWIFRADAAWPPAPEKTIVFRENHAQMGYRSFFRVFQGGKMVLSVKGVHRGRLPVLSGTQADKLWVYDTLDGTQQLISHAAEKVRDNLGTVKLTTNKES